METFRADVETPRTVPNLPQHSDGTRQARTPLHATSVARPALLTPAPTTDDNAPVVEPGGDTLPSEPAASGVAEATTDEQLAEWQRLVECREAEWQRLVAHLEWLLDSGELRARQGIYHAMAPVSAAAPDGTMTRDAGGAPSNLPDPWATAPAQAPARLLGDGPPEHGADPAADGELIPDTAPGLADQEAPWIWPHERSLAGRIRGWMSSRRTPRP